MTGGGNKINRGAMSSVPQKAYVSPQRMKDLTSERATVESEYKLNVEKKHKKQKELERQQKRYLELETLLPKLEIELRAADENVKTAKKTLNELKRPEANQLSKEDTAKVDSLRQQEEQQHRNIEKLREQCKNIEQEIRELNTKIMQAGGVALRTQTVKVDGIKEKIALINEEITSGDVKKTKAGLELARGSKELGRCKDEKERVHEELEQVNASIGNKRQLQAKLSEELKDTRIQAEEIKDQVEAFKSELDVNINKFNKIRKAGAKLQMEADDLERAETEHQRKGKYWKSSIESLVLQTLPAELEEAVDIPTTLPVFEEETLCETDEAMLEKEIEQIQAKLQTAKPNLSVLVEFAKRAKELGAHTAELDSITTQRDDAVESYTRLHKQRLDEFMAGFNAISHKLKEMYQLITLGGSAELELVDSLDPFAEGIVFSVMPPKKSWKNISDLSGGEKTLSSLALVFALHQYKPTPIYVMDEIDAALDFRNVSIVANYIKERTKDAQFIVISLRNNMFELADWLVGVYKFENKTKSLPVNPKPFQKLLSNSL
ncbi:Structural maintenance of chromosomes protein 4 [Zancudomyces culisetae]|uniref:Structural maintenance of chromosomes protein 4 n=1 Tax=Zancudomyces culisetae TaxID=1213189 RepID=A0A1R1PYP0_ZANCU|nr:Structural maintenance of chromosomes protein 4 [Zancudomyces culisetae]|eukprot:OMH86070.1 Structural maintenance of chromosomes protein 4 [Zancudomyces culisetae]